MRVHICAMQLACNCDLDIKKRVRDAGVHTCMNVCAHMKHLWRPRVFIHTYVYRHTNMHAYMHACIHTYIHTYIHKHTHGTHRQGMHIYIHAQMYTYAMLRMYIPTHTHTCAGLPNSRGQEEQKPYLEFKFQMDSVVKR